MPKERDIRSSAAEYLTYVAATGNHPESVEMRYEDENIWLTQKMLAALYGFEVHTINEHISKVFVNGELIEQATIRNFRIVQAEVSTGFPTFMLCMANSTAFLPSKHWR